MVDLASPDFQHGLSGYVGAGAMHLPSHPTPGAGGTARAPRRKSSAARGRPRLTNGRSTDPADIVGFRIRTGRKHGAADDEEDHHRRLAVEDAEKELGHVVRPAGNGKQA